MQDTEIKALINALNELKREVIELRNEKQSSSSKELLTRQEVAKLLKIDLSTLHHWTKSGILIKYGIGKRVYYKQSEVENAIVQLETLKL
ncbi:helix-turn-helix domain-containing protein [Gillisia sp. Hel_I_29]|uniref:helix-turn-helix domain-containing protein n=1 Tax=Gillisia sp. Hel_I_29 TaxID=1249975 RepID=UPI00055240A6|nr:helix-turn-helix domain-containing protein [Gillisia sp. Hel_I_29]